jgi:FkbM family methyltransferase
MTFVSYSQNAEDVLLWRALGHVQRGFYIDVGANDPVEHSVTKAFYDRGWRGVSVEPLPSFHHAFEEQRPEDVNLAIAAGAVNGELTLYDVPAVRGWASPEQSVAEMHRAEGHQVAEIKVPVRTLAAICEEHVHGEIHFLKIDVEGFEGEVLRGMDFVRWRPWVLVIEATLPNSRSTNHHTWEHLVLGERYRFAWFDGLNRYYVADEHAELLAQLDVQPNVFDEFISWHLDHAWNAERTLHAELQSAAQRQQAQEQQVERYRAQSAELLAQLAAANRRADHAHSRAVDLGHELDQVHADAAGLTVWAKGLETRIADLEASTSWKITRPLRRASDLVRSLREPLLLKRIVKRLTRVEFLRRLLIPILLRHPALNKRVAASLVAVKQAVPDPLPPDVAHVPDELRGLPISVRGVLADLKRARNPHTGS